MSNARSLTVLGAGGWVGGAVVSELRKRGRHVHAIYRSTLNSWLSESDDPGGVIYTIGLTADFRNKPLETIEAHVSLLSRVLQRPRVDTLIYLSSSRVYTRSTNTQETAALPCLSQDPSDLYNLSKLTGEALILQDPRPGLKVVRLSNVVGLGQPKTNFLGCLLDEARSTGQARILQSPKTAKDYIALSDAVRILIALADESKERIYNLGTGKNRSHLEIATWLESHGIFVSFSESKENGITFPALNVERLTSEYGELGDPFAQKPF
jgi:nucleoside-diphosphate-sugar epimerase